MSLFAGKIHNTIYVIPFYLLPRNFDWVFQVRRIWKSSKVKQKRYSRLEMKVQEPKGKKMDIFNLVLRRNFSQETKFTEKCSFASLRKFDVKSSKMNVVIRQSNRKTKRENLPLRMTYYTQIFCFQSEILFCGKVKKFDDNSLFF